MYQQQAQPTQLSTHVNPAGYLVDLDDADAILRLIQRHSIIPPVREEAPTRDGVIPKSVWLRSLKAAA